MHEKEGQDFTGESHDIAAFSRIDGTHHEAHTGARDEEARFGDSALSDKTDRRQIFGDKEALDRYKQAYSSVTTGNPHSSEAFESEPDVRIERGDPQSSISDTSLGVSEAGKRFHEALNSARNGRDEPQERSEEDATPMVQSADTIENSERPLIGRYNRHYTWHKVPVFTSFWSRDAAERYPSTPRAQKDAYRLDEHMTEGDTIDFVPGRIINRREKDK
jgi:hypothetical protein